jgi:DNA-binding GntR family transcriptional regulator
LRALFSKLSPTNTGYGVPMEYFELQSTVLGLVRTKIISGELAPGEKINENQLASSLGISRSPLREVLRVLEQEHLVVHFPRKGTRVSEISVQELEEIYEVRELVELGAIDLMMKKGITEPKGAIAAINEAKDIRLPNQDISKEIMFYREKITDFHVKLIEECGNCYLIKYYKTIYFSLARYQYLHFRYTPRGGQSLNAHKEVLQYIQAGAYKEAKDALLAHIRYSFDFQREILRGSISEKKKTI